MTLSQEESQRYQSMALAAIKELYGTKDGEDTVTQFVTDHLEEADKDYLQKHLGTATPEPVQLLDILILRSHWTDGDAEIFEFALPEDIRNSVISVQFDSEGNLVDIVLE